MELVKPTEQYKESYLKLVQEFKEDSQPTNPFVINVDCSDWSLFMQSMRDMELGYNQRKGLVPCITYWMIDDKNRIVAVSNIRTRLNPGLIASGGHIGYGVRPSCRGKGYGKKILELSLQKCGQLGIFDVMVSCDPKNEGSKKIILSNGGHYDSTITTEGEQYERYWIFI